MKVKKILVCPLDWGLGHATRSIPVIWELQKQGAEVSIASSGGAAQLLKVEFPNLKFFELPPYAAVYPSNGSMALTIARQMPKFRKAIHGEHNQIEKLVLDQKINVVISDNRFGCWSSKARSVFITHQVKPIMPKGFKWMTPLVQHFIGNSINHFEQIWIPDQQDSGMTAPFTPVNVNQKYIGWLSRFKPLQDREKKYEILALVSGPEPQRTIFERLITAELKNSGKKSLLVAGQPGDNYKRDEGNLEIVNHLPLAALQEAIASSEIILSRSGYSTVMDLIALGKKAILIPTPQQTEQLFIAEFCKSKQIAFSMNQEHFSLSTALEESVHYSGFSRYTMDDAHLRNAISSILNS